MTRPLIVGRHRTIRRRKITVLLLVCASFGVAWMALFQRSTEEPVYNGKTLNAWLVPTERINGVIVAPSFDEALAAIRQMGTNAIPNLLAMMEREPPYWRYRVRDQVCKLFSKLPSPLPCSEAAYRLQHFIDPQAAHGLAGQAAFMGFKALGTNGVAAIPALSKLMKSSNGFASTDAMIALCELREDGVPSLLDYLSEAKNRNRSSAATYVGWMGREHLLGTNATRAVKLLVACLNDEDSDEILMRTSATALGEMNFSEDIVVPALVKCLGHTNADVRVDATIAIRKFGRRGRVAVPALVKALEDKYLIAATVAADGLAEIALEPDIVIPALVSALKRKEFQVHQSVIWALAQYGERGLPVLLECLRSEDFDIADTAARYLGHLPSPPERAIPALTNALRSRFVGLRFTATDTLVKFGRKAAPAVPLLIQNLESEHSGLVGRTAEALGQIASQPELTVPALTHILDHSDWTVKYRALQALAHFGTAAQSAVPLVTKMLDDTEEHVRAEAQLTLEKIKPQILSEAR
jgi:HEAT repeat protein